MPIRIAQIEVEELGPINQFSLRPGSVNLIYGHNEQGKTHLVEFLIRSLFRFEKKWLKRTARGSGKVVVTGLDEQPIVFSPASSRKLEDYWKKMEGLPPHFNRLLVVRGAEAMLPFAEGEGVNRAALRHFLSNQPILERIGKTINETIKKAQIQEGNLLGKQVGELKTREDRLRELREIDRLFEAIESVYVESEFKALQEQIKALEQRRDLLEKARRHRAYRLACTIREKEEKIRRWDPEGLQQAREWLTQLRTFEKQIERDRQRLTEAEEVTAQQIWLEHAIEVYRDHEKYASKKAALGWWLFPFFFMACGIGFFLMDWTLGLLFVMGLSLLYSLLVVSQIPRFARKAWHAEGLRQIASAYESRFGAPLSSEVDLKARLEEVKTRLVAFQLHREKVAEAQSRCEALSLQMASFFAKTLGFTPDSGTWEDHIEQLDTKVKTLQREVESLKGELQGLEVLPSEYEESDLGISYSRKEEKEIIGRIDAIRQEMIKREEALKNLKQQICSKTGDSYGIDWENLIAHLREKRQEIAAAYREITAEILGKMAVNRILERLREEEDRKIEEGLNSEALLDPLYRLTGRYRHFRVDSEGILRISDELDGDGFPFSELSTGAQEQVLLALRIGFARHWLHRESESLFLILDDAFQYSDYSRRKRLVEMVFDLASSGWQIFYFTMDDHLRDLFDRQGVHLKEAYVKRVLR